MFGTIKKIILWKYERGSWQWDLMCLAIIAFIFLTPKDWFEAGAATQNECNRKCVHHRPKQTCRHADGVPAATESAPKTFPPAGR